MGGEVCMNKKYTEINSKVIDKWVEEGWEWGQKISHELFERAKNNDWFVLLTPTKPVPKDWFCDMKGAEILGLAAGGGQQMPIFTALGAKCTVLDYSDMQLLKEKEVAERENYEITLVKADMTDPLPFEDESFDLIFHPVSNCYIEDVFPVWKECYRVLKKGGILLSGLDNGINYIFDDEEKMLVRKLPFNPLKDKQLYEESVKNNWGIQFSHTIEEQIGGQLKAGFILTDIYQDTNGTGRLHEFNVPTFYATRAVKK
jgi:SAM-dependent methyltransferase